MVLAFSGKIGSGKSTVSTAVAQALHLPQVSFGHYVRQQAQLQHLEQSRQQLQDLGEHLLKEDALGFCQAVLDQVSNWENGVVVDGVRHQSVLHILKQLVLPQSLTHIHLTLDEELRARRLAQRLGEATADAQELYRMNTHPTERQVVETLLDSADIVVDSAISLDIVAAQIVKQVARG